MMLFWQDLCHDLLLIDLFVMQSKTEDEIFGKILAILLKIKDDTKLRKRKKIFIILELFYSIILECLPLLKFFKCFLLSETIKCLFIPWIFHTLYVHLSLNLTFVLFYLLAPLLENSLSSNWGPDLLNTQVRSEVLKG